jgi:hypothetical protein
MTNKYSINSIDERVSRITGNDNPSLVYAAYADSSWDKFISALNLIETCFAGNNLVLSWPLSASDVRKRSYCGYD